MKLGIIGLPQSGKKTVFEALSGQKTGESTKNEALQAMLRVPDQRVDRLAEMFRPRKTTYAQVEYALPAKSSAKPDAKEPMQLSAARDCDAFIHVVRNFRRYGTEEPTPEADFKQLDSELMLLDQIAIEKRLERIEADRKRGKKGDPDEKESLDACHALLERGEAIRRDPILAAHPSLRGFAFFSAKPLLVLFNNADDDDAMPQADCFSEESCSIIKAKLEQEICGMDPEEAAVFLSEFHLTASATDRVIATSYSLMGLISFFTVGEDEVKAWTITRSTSALDAAGVIHSDIKKGFIRAEVIGYQELMDVGSFAEARKKGLVRLEGKTYEVQDGDIVHFRFNVG
ncbi:DUF933 domain-containing protein [Desulfatirhabdium butyrativorans]|uniref:DUF933 domain-containing protein n=1 Tax=Desulfatirhabdium butyrativorans TaxID=340467 RepID=UPI000405D8EE|nr:DUF933 domain-containing protein [Desulfatirhabdium butyrativorans]